MEEIISKEELSELEKIEGATRGITIKLGVEFILKEQGEEGLKKLEDTMAEIGHPIKYKKIKSLNLHPMKTIAINLLVSKRIFNWDDKKFREMGEFSAKFPLFIRMLSATGLFSFKILVEQVPKIWKKYYTKGDLKIIELNEEKRYIIIRLENFVYSPLYCKVLEGLLSVSVKMIVKKPVFFKETKCTFRGDEYHEFLMKW